MDWFVLPPSSWWNTILYLCFGCRYVNGRCGCFTLRTFHVSFQLFSFTFIRDFGAIRSVLTLVYDTQSFFSYLTSSFTFWITVPDIASIIGIVRDRMLQMLQMQTKLMRSTSIWSTNLQGETRGIGLWEDIFFLMGKIHGAGCKISSHQKGWICLLIIRYDPERWVRRLDRLDV